MSTDGAVDDSVRERPVRVGLVGCGGIGTHHMRRLQEQPCVFVGGVDISAEARETFTEEFGVPTYESFSSLDEEGVDAVIVTTPNKYHEECAVEALDADVHVLIEKPLAHTLESAERIAEAASASEAFAMLGFHNRFRQGAEVLTGHREDGRFGDVTHVEANYIRRRGVPGRGSWFTTREIAGGGSLIDIGVHAIDLALHFLGFPEVVEVSGQTRSEFGSREDYSYLGMYGPDTDAEHFDVDDSASAFVRFADGSTMSLEVAWATNRPPTNEFVIRGTGAGATYDLGDGSLTIHETDDTGAPQLSDAEIQTRDEDAYDLEQTYFLDHVRADQPPERNTIDQALSVQRVIDAIYRSAEKNRAVRLDD